MSQYLMPTKVIQGRGCVQAQGGLMKPLGSHALIVTGANSAKASGALDDVIAALEANGQGWTLFDKAEPNPSIESVYAGAAAARDCGADFIIAIGGGSPMDTGKAVALLAAQDIPQEELYLGNYGPEVLPNVCIPTTSGTGSEVTQYSVLTYHAGKTKKSIGTPLIFPRLAYLDGAYTDGLSHRLTISTAIDALSHCVEGMLSNLSGGISDTLALEGCRRVAECFDAMAEDALIPEQRDSLMLASTLGGMTIAATGTTAVHAMGYPLTYFHDIEHGRANGLLMGAFLELAMERLPERTAVILEACGCESAAQFRSIMDRLLGEREGLSEENMENYCAKVIQTKNIAKSMMAIGIEDLEAIYRKSMME